MWSVNQMSSTVVRMNTLHDWISNNFRVDHVVFSKHRYEMMNRMDERHCWIIHSNVAQEFEWEIHPIDVWHPFDGVEIRSNEYNRVLVDRSKTGVLNVASLWSTIENSVVSYGDIDWWWIWWNSCTVDWDWRVHEVVWRFVYQQEMICLHWDLVLLINEIVLHRGMFSIVEKSVEIRQMSRCWTDMIRKWLQWIDSLRRASLPRDRVVLWFQSIVETQVDHHEVNHWFSPRDYRRVDSIDFHRMAKKRDPMFEQVCWIFLQKYRAIKYSISQTEWIINTEISRNAIVVYLQQLIAHWVVNCFSIPFQLL